MPALPLDEAGKYVAGAYVVFVALILIYVAIMAAKLQRIERELGELADLAERQAPAATARRSPPMSELLALGISHKTAPLELRERLALTEGRAAGVLSELVDARPEVHEAAAISTCNRTELYLVARRPGRGRVAGARACSPARRRSARPSWSATSTRCAAADAAAPPVPGHRRARLDDHRRGRDPGPGQARLRAGAGRGRDRADPQPALPRRARRRQAGALGDRHLRAGRSRSPRSRSSWRSARSATSPSRRVLVVGAGETAELTARALAARGVEPVFIANRHYDRAIGLAQRFGGRAVRFEELPDAAGATPTSSSPRPARRTT